MLNSLPLALKVLWREWRFGEWLIVFFSLFLAIAAITSLNFYTDRLLRGLDLQSAKFLGGDLAISSSTPIPAEWVNRAKQLRLRTAEVWLYPSVVSASNKLQLVDVQAVDQHFPLLSDAFLHPEKDTLWVEPRLLPLLSISSTDTITLGAKTFRISKLLTSDVNSLNAKWTIAPRVLMRLDDVAATRTVIPGSRVDYRLLIVGSPSEISDFKQWLTPQLQPGQLLLDIHNQQFALRDFLQRTEHYLQLTLLICLMMSGVAIALSIQQYLRRHYHSVALWRCLGARQTQVRSIFLWQLIIIALTAGLLAIITGYFAQAFFANLFKDYMQFPLPNASGRPALFGFITSLLLLFAFALPAIIELPRSSPLALWRNEVSGSFRRNMLAASLLLVLMLFIYWFMHATSLTLFILLALLASVFILYLLSRVLLYALRFMLTFTEGVIRRGLSQLVHHPDSFSLQFVGFNLIIILLILLWLVRTDLIKEWRQSLPKQAPNYFAINIAPADIASLQQFLRQNNVPVEGIYPMVRGRLVELNDKPILTAVPKEAVNNNALHRELNLSWMWQLPSDNKIVHGELWTVRDANKPLVSVESKLAEDLQLHLGDQLTFQIGDRQLTAVISNFRTLDWQSFHPNFFMIFPPGFLKDFAATYITSFHLTPGQTDLLNKLVELFPNITVIDVANLLQQVQDLLEKIIIAIQYLFLFALGIGLLIFIASIQATSDERRKSYRILHLLGASKRFIHNSIMTEFGCITVVIILISLSIAYLIDVILEAYFLFT